MSIPCWVQSDIAIPYQVQRLDGWPCKDPGKSSPLTNAHPGYVLIRAHIDICASLRMITSDTYIITMFSEELLVRCDLDSGTDETTDRGYRLMLVKITRFVMCPSATAIVRSFTVRGKTKDRLCEDSGR